MITITLGRVHNHLSASNFTPERKEPTLNTQKRHQNLFHRRLTNCAKFYVFYIRSSSHSRQYLKDEVICVAKQSGETTTGNLPLRFPKTYFAAQLRQNVVMRIADLFPPAAFTNPTRDLLPLCITVEILNKVIGHSMVLYQFAQYRCVRAKSFWLGLPRWENPCRATRDYC